MAKDTWSRVRRKSKRSIQNVEAEVVRSFLEAPLDLHESESTPRVVSRGTSVQSFLDFCRAEGPATSSRAVSVQSLLSSDEASQQKHEALAQDSVQMALTFTAADDGRNSGTLMSDPASNLSSHRSCEQAALEKPKVDIADTSRPPSPTPPPVDALHSVSGGSICHVPQAEFKQERTQEEVACLPTQSVPFPTSQCFKEHYSATLPLSENPTLLTSKHLEDPVRKAPKLYDRYEPESTIILGMPPVIPSDVPSQQILGTARSAAPTVYELPAAAASQRTPAIAQSTDISMDPFLHTAPATQSRSDVLTPRGLTSKTYDIACLASRLAGQWAFEAGGTLAASTKEASVSAAGMLMDATRNVDSSVKSYAQQAWGSVLERMREEEEEEDTESESSSDDEDSPARAAVRAHGHSHEHPVGYLHAAFPAAGVPPATQLAVQHPRSASFSIPTAGYPSTLLAGSYQAGSPAWHAAGQQHMLQAPLAHGNTVSLSIVDPRLQALPHALPFNHGGVAAPHLHSSVGAAPFLQR